MQETQETWVRSLGWEDSLEKGMATHSSVLAWIIPWTEEPGRLQSMGLKELGQKKKKKKAIAFTIASKRIRYLGINLRGKHICTPKL